MSNSPMSAEADQLLQQGIEQCENGQLEAGLESWKKALNLYRTLQDLESEGKTLNNLGFAYSSVENYTEAIKAYQQSLEVGRRIKNRSMEVNALAHLGQAYSTLGDSAQTIKFYLQALPIAQELNNRQGEGAVVGGLAVAYEELGEYQEAAEYYQLMLTVAQELNDRQTQGAALSGLGRTHQALENYLQAAELLEQRLAIAQELQDRVGEQAASTILGNIYSSLSQYSRAIQLHQQSLALAQKLNKPAAAGEILNNLGNNYADLGQYQLAIDYYQKSLEIAQQINDTILESEVLLNLGTLYQVNLEDYQKAVGFYQRSLTVSLPTDRLDFYKVTSLLKDQAEACVRMGTIYQVLADNKQAEELYQQGMTIAEEINDKTTTAEILNNLGTLYHINLGDYQKAVEFYEQSLDISRGIKKPETEGKALGNLGSAYDSLKEYSLAINYQQERLKLARKIQDKFGEGLALNNLGATLLHAHKFSEAEETLLKGVEVWEFLRRGLGSNDAAKISIFEGQARTYRLLQKALIAQQKTEKIEMALEVAERGRARAFVDLLASRLPSETVAVEVQYSVPSLTLNDIKFLAQSNNATFVEYSILYETLELEGQSIQAQELELLIWVIQSTGEIKFHAVDLEPLTQQKTSLSDLVIQVRRSLGVEKEQGNALSTANQERAQPLPLRQLHQYIIEPITNFLPTDPNSHVIFIPQGSLFLVPFPALQDATGKFLIEQHTILTAPSIQVLELTHQQRIRLAVNVRTDVTDELSIGKQTTQRTDNLSVASPANLVVGNPTMPTIPLREPPRPLEPLPGSEAEAKGIALLLNTQPIIGEAATKVYIKKLMPKARRIHLATHGLLDDIKQLGVAGAIALAPSDGDNGFLTASEILEMKLNAELVVLSACSSGQGKITGDGVIGLSRCLFAAGVPSVVVSLWSVGDCSTEFLMREFYQNLHKRMNKAKALRQAILTTREDFSGDPYSWAAFTIIGEAD